MEIISTIQASLRKRSFPDGKPYDALATADIQRIAAKHQQHPRDIEIMALENGVIPERYARNMQTLSTADQIVLLNSCVTVVGLGGLGGGVVEVLSRVGIGTLHLVDGDRFEDSNLNRQLLSRNSLLDTFKAEAAAQRVLEINSAVDVHTHCVFLDEGNADQLIGSAHVVVDCLDNIHTRFTLEKAAQTAQIPMVSAAVAGTTGQAITIFPGDPGLTSIYGDLNQTPSGGVECTLGTLPFTAMFFSALECSEVIKILLTRGVPLAKKLLMVDLSEADFNVLALS